MAKALIPALTSDRMPTDLEALIRVEKEIDQRVKAFGQASVEFAPVVQVLTIINDSKAWQWHADDDGEPTHKSFKAYVESFGWSQSVPRLYQLMSEFRREMIDAHNADPDEYPKIEGINYDHQARTRSTGTSFERFLATQTKAMDTVSANVVTAAHNIFESDPNRAEAINLAETFREQTIALVRDMRDTLEQIKTANDEAKAQARAEKKAATAALKGRPIHDPEADRNVGDEDEDDDEGDALAD